jgi:hypothetical protein
MNHKLYRSPQTTVTEFMLYDYLGSKYERSFQAMVAGQRHRLHWGEEEPIRSNAPLDSQPEGFESTRKELSDVVKSVRI